MKESLMKHSIAQLENGVKEFPQLWNVSQIVILLINKKFYRETDMSVEQQIQQNEEILQWTEVNKEALDKYGSAIINNLKLNLKQRILYLKTESGQKIELQEIISALHLRKNLQEFISQNKLSCTIQNFQLCQDQSSKPDFISYVRNYFCDQQCEDVDAFLAFYDFQYLKSIFDEAKVCQGFGQKYDSLSLSQIKAIQEKEVLEFTKNNPKTFEMNEEVILHLQVKNIEKVTCQVFVVDQEILYQRNSNLDSLRGKELQGIYPNFLVEQVISNLHFGKLQHISIPIPQISAGLFIVDIYGGKLSSRVQIKKGALTYVQRETISGHLLTIYNEVGQKCSNSGVWLEKRYFKANENGKVLIPYRQKGGQQERNILVTDGVRFEILKFIHQEENYKLESAFIVNEEQLVMGCEANIVVIPKLLVNNQLGNLKLLSNIELSIFSVDEKDSTSQKTFTDLQLNSNNRIEVTYQVPAKVMGITFQFRAQVTKIGATEALNLQREYKVSLRNTKNMEFIDFYLKQAKDFGYYLQVLGRNGETKKEVQILLQLKNTFQADHDEVMLKSDQNGIILLGSLEGIYEIQATCQKPHNFRKTFQISNDWNHIQYETQTFHITSQENLSLALPKENCTIAQFLLLKIDNSSVLQNCTSQIKLSGHALEIQNLQIGNYQLKYPGNQYTIQVHQGTFNQEHVLVSNNKVKIREENPSFTIASIQHQPTQLLIQLNGNFQNVQAIALLRHFLSEQSFVEAKKLTQQQRINFREQTIDQKVEYYQTRSLGDELIYILNRKNQQEKLGNTCQKPQLLINPLLVGETTTQRETILPSSDLRPQDYFCDDFEMDECSQALSKKVQMPNFFNGFIQFLDKPGKVINNISVDEQGKIEIPIEDYGSVSLILINRNQLICKNISLKEVTHQLPLKDISLQEGFLPNHAYAETRVPTTLLCNQQIKIEDLASAQLTIVDSLSKAFDVLVQEAKTMHKDEVDKQLQEWRFLTNWNKLSKEKKDSLYDKYFSHELNVFLKFKDPSYFQSTVAPFLQNKLEKQFLDRILLDEDLNAFCRIDQLQKLNDFEKALLSKVLNKKLSLQSRQFSDSDYNKYFDTVLLLAKDLNEDELAQMIEEEKIRAMEENKIQIKQAQKLMESQQNFDPDSIQDKIMLCCSSSPYQMDCNIDYNEERKYCFVEECCEGSGGGGEGDYILECANLEEEGDEEEEREESDEEYIEEQYLIQQRVEQQQLYKVMDATKEYSETHYYNQKDPLQFGSLIVKTPFFAKIASKGDNLDFCFMYSIDNLTEALTTLALIDLPFQSGQHGFKAEGRGVVIKAASNMIVFCKRTGIAEENGISDIITALRYFDPEDRFYTNSQGERVEKNLKELTTDKIIGCQVVVTNLTSYHLNLSVLAEIPKFSIPIGTQECYKQKLISLPSYQTNSIEIYFYFPKAGAAMHAGVNVSNLGKVVSKSKDVNLKVIADQEKKLSKQVSFKEVLDSCDDKEILN